MPVTGAAIGAMIGAIGGPVGIAIGAGIGAGVGAIVGNAGASHAKKKYEEELQKENEEKAAALLAREQSKYKEYDLKAALADTSVSAEEFEKKFQAKVLEKLKKGFGDVKMSLEDISDMAKHLVFGDAESSLKSFSSAAAKAKQDFEAMSNTADELKKLNWKAALAYEGKMKWSDEDNENFIYTTESMIEQAQNYLEDKHFEAQMAVNLIFGENSETGADIMEGISGMYSQLQGQVDELSKEANIILSKDGGILTFEEQTEVNNLLSQITDITNMLNEADAEAELDLLTIKYGGSQMDYDSFAQLQQQIPEYLDKMTTGLDESYKTIVQNIRLEAKLNPDYDPTNDLEAAAQEYTKKLQEKIQGVIDYQMELIEIALNNDESVNVDDILPDLDGDISTRLKTAITEALEEKPDVSSWDTEYWMQILGLSSDSTLAAELQNLLTPVAEQMKQGLSTTIQDGVQKAYEDAANGMTSDEAKAALEKGVENAKNGFTAAVQEKAPEFSEGFKPAAQSAVEGYAEEFSSENTATATANGVEAVRSSTAAAVEASGEAFGEVLDPAAQNMLNGFITEITETSDEAAKSAFDAFKSSVESAFSQEIKLGATVTVKANTNYINSGEDATKHAEGGIMTRPHLGLVAEDGAEAIIPLSGKRRSRGISLWERAGKLLGVKKYADGGIIGNVETAEENTLGYSPVPIIQTGTPTVNTGSEMSVPITIENISFEVHVEGGQTSENIVEIIKKNTGSLTNEIAAQLAASLTQVFANMPMAAKGV